MQHPLLCLCLILKNEAHTILRTLNSCASFVDYFAIYDTGSTDGTQEVIRSWRSLGFMDDLGNGSLLEEGEFRDYSYARNRALDLAATIPYSAKYALSLSADETLVGGEKLRAFLDTYEGDETALLVEVRATGGLFDYPRVLRLGSRWRYEHEVHEVPKYQGDLTRQPRIKIPGCWIEYQPTDPQRHAERLKQYDLPALSSMRKNAKDESDRTRALLLLAQTYEALAAIEGGNAGDVFEKKVVAVEHQAVAFGYYLLLAQTSTDPNLVFKLLNAADVLGVYTSPELLTRLRPVAKLHPNDPAVAYMIAVHTANIDAQAGLAAAKRAAAVAEAAVVDKEHPYDPHGLLWRPHFVAAMCAKAVGDRRAVEEHVQAGLFWRGPETTFKELMESQRDFRS